MRICINAAAANQGGAVTHLHNLLPRLVELDYDDTILVIAPDSTLDALGDVLAHPKVESERYPHPPGQFARRLLFDQVDVPAVARRFRADLLFSSNGFGTLLSGRPEALLVRNSIYFSRSLERRLRDLNRSLREIRLRRTMSLLSMRTASAVMFPSRAMQSRVERFISLDKKPTRAIHYGFDRERFLSGQRPAEDVLAPIESWRRSGRTTLLYVSGYAVHKNFETAIEALAALLESGLDVGLVLTAEWKPFGEMVEFEAMQNRVRELGIEAHVLMVGQQPWTHLHALYAAADVHLWPTILESFGHPMLEAMASGLPTVAAETDVNREILSDAAEYFDALDVGACSTAIRSVIEDTERAAAMRQAAAEQVQGFSWRAHATELRDFFAELVPSSA